MRILEEFKKFALRGSVLDMAIGFTVGAAFTAVAKSLVSDVLMPPIGLVIGNVDFSELFVVLRDGAKTAPPYASVAEAQAAGAVTLNYGAFLNNMASLVVVALAMFIVIRFANRVDDALERTLRRGAKPGDPATKKCRHCLSTVPYKATRCPDCTSHLNESGAAKKSS